jgi:hypothetical protein
MEFSFPCLSLLSLCADRNNTRHLKKRKIFSKVVIAKKEFRNLKEFRENFRRNLTFWVASEKIKMNKKIF